MRSRVCSGIWKKNNIEIRWTREEFRDWWLAQADRVLAIRAEGHSPSIDRRDPLGHYCEANCRIIPHHVNAALGEVNGLVSRMRVLQDLLKKNEHWLRD